MKKWLGVLLAAILVLALAACGGNNNDNAEGGKDGKLVKLKVGASNVPHAEILEKAKPILK